jgi:RES domain-containing protein
VDHIRPAELPRNWRSSPPPAPLQSIGTRWLTEQRRAVLAVPSAVLPIETNYLINPEHPDFKSIEIGEIKKLDIDPRLSR